MKKNTSNQPENKIANPVMRREFLKAATLLGLGTLAAGAGKSYANAPQEGRDSSANNSISQMEIKIGSSTFTVTLYDNATARAFKALLPLTINMTELNSNEKYFDFPTSLPVNSLNPGTIQKGDLMMYGSKTLVLFYKSFVTSHSYTKLGRINDPEGLSAALGTGNVTVAFKL